MRTFVQRPKARQLTVATLAGRSQRVQNGEGMAARGLGGRYGQGTGRPGVSQSGGEPLPEGIRRGMERAFGHDFGRVRVHRDAEAGEMSRRLGAQAFTYGSHIYFGHGRFDAAGGAGRRLLAHELAHVVQQAPRPRGPDALRAAFSPPAIQRSAIWAVGTVNENYNLADRLLHAPAIGYTPPMLNSIILTSTAQARAAVNGPALAFSSPAGGGANVRVYSAPDNTGSYEENVLGPGPWTTVVAKNRIGWLLNLIECRVPGDTTFQAMGDPSDAEMRAANRRHEDQHVRFIRDAFTDTFGDWDDKLEDAQAAKTPFSGPTRADAEAALYQAMGGTPAEVGEKFYSLAAAKGDAYHRTLAGGPPKGPIDPKADADCANSSAKYRNPA